MTEHFERRLLTAAIAQVLFFGCLLAAGSTAFATTASSGNAAVTVAGDQDMQRALIELKNAVAADPDNPELRYRLGNLYLEMRQGSAAEKEFNRALGLGRDDFELRLRLGEAWLQQGRFEKLFGGEFDQSAADSDRDRADLAVLQGNARLVQGNYNAAQDLFEQALAAVPEYAPALIGVIEALIEQAELGPAQIALGRLRNAADADPTAILRLDANIAMAFGRPEEAVGFYRDALNARPWDPILLRGLARAQYERGDLDDALASINRLLSRYPDDADALYLKALTAYRQQDYKLAVQLASALGARPGTTGAGPLFIAGAASYFDGSFQQAREYLARFVALSPDDRTGRQLYGAALLMTDDAAKALAALLPLADEADQDATTLTLLGMAAGLAGDPNKGVNFLQRALELDPENTSLRSRLAATRLLTQDREQGIAELRAIADEAGDYAPAQFVLAGLALSSGDYASAAGAARRSVEAAPDLPESKVIEALAILGQGKLDEAEASFNAILEQHPDHLDAHLGLADVRLRRGDPAGAHAIIERMSNAAPGNVKLQLNLAGIERLLGRSAQAETRLKRVLADNPANPDARVALADHYLAEHLPQSALELLQGGSPAAAPETPIELAMARAEIALDRPADAAARLQTVLKQNPGSVPARLLLADAHARNGQPDLATQQADKAVEIAPNDLSARAERARILLSQPTAPADRLQVAAEDVGDLWKRHPTDAKVQLVRALAILRYPGAEAQVIELLRGAHAGLKSTESATTLADVLMLLGQQEAARNVLDTWLTLHPQDNYARRRRAAVLAEQGDYASAAADLTAAFDRGARSGVANAQAALMLALAGDTAAAREYVNRAGAEHADDPYVLHAQALLELQNGRAKAALRSLEQAVAAAGADATPRLWFDVAQAQISAGNPGEARTILKAILDSGRSFPERAEAEGLLRGL
jgi:putative PEP-CTERM system TPR-repeat lipoprotein